MIWKPKIIWSCDLKYENNLILWSEIRKHFDLMIWDRKIIWSYDLRSENNLIHDPFGRDHVILISSYFVIAWFWSAYFCDPRFLDHFFLWSRDFDLENFKIFNFWDHAFWFHNCDFFLCCPLPYNLPSGSSAQTLRRGRQPEFLTQKSGFGTKRVYFGLLDSFFGTRE